MRSRSIEIRSASEVIQLPSDPWAVSSVDVSPHGVVIEAVECRLDGSAEVQRLGLNDLFELEVKVVLQGTEGDKNGPTSLMMSSRCFCNLKQKKQG